MDPNNVGVPTRRRGGPRRSSSWSSRSPRADCRVAPSTNSWTTTPANWVSAQNGRPGTSDWRIAKMRTAGSRVTGTSECQVGDSVTLYVTTPAKMFHVEAFRMGWYHGLGGRLVWRSADTRPDPARRHDRRGDADRHHHLEAFARRSGRGRLVAGRLPPQAGVAEGPVVCPADGARRLEP